MSGRIEQLADGVTLYPGDCLDALKTIETNNIGACVTDPPYGLGFMGKDWDRGVPGVGYWKAMLRVLRPGAHLLSFGGTRTFHRMACAIEDAGFEIRDTIMWVYGSGFPKSHDVSKSLDRAAGAERKIIGLNPNHRGESQIRNQFTKNLGLDGSVTSPTTPAARQWEGWGTALKPACELIVLARKPLSEGTVAANVLRWGVGALNIDGCRVGADGGTKGCDAGPSNGILGDGLNGAFGKPVPGLGRWPANVIHDGSEEVLAGFPESDHAPGSNGRKGIDGACYGHYGASEQAPGYKDEGSAARFFYSAKADAMDRLGSKHPTVKPLDLMQYLVRLVTPPKGLVLDPFAGSGTTGEAAFREGFRAVLIEREPEYQDDIRRRMALVLSGPDERAREAAKARMKDKPVDAGPLFAALNPAKQEAFEL